MISKNSSKVLIARLGAIGDTIITTPLVNLLYSLGYKIYYLTSEVGAVILQNNPKIEKVITHVRDSVPSTKLGDYFKEVAKANECGYVIDLCESIEVNLALHPADPRYKYTKYERKDLCDKNYYEETIEIASRQLKEQGGLPLEMPYRASLLNPEYFYTNEEDKAMRKIFADFQGAYVIVLGLSGSARQKVFPYYKELIEVIIKEIPTAQFITVGDESCQILEYNLSGMDNVLCTSGIWSIRQSIHATKYADLVISPDTGLLHGSGCYETPKIGLLTSTSIENITKHFVGDNSIEASGVACAPCFYLIHDADTQCVIGENRSCLCMSKGHNVDKILNKVIEIYYSRPLMPKGVLQIA